MTEVHTPMNADFLCPPLFDRKIDLFTQNIRAFSLIPFAPSSLDFHKEIQRQNFRVERKLKKNNNVLQKELGDHPVQLAHI